MKKTLVAILIAGCLVVLGAVEEYNNSPEKKIADAQKELDRMHQVTQEAYEDYYELQERLEEIERLQELLGY